MFCFLFFLDCQLKFYGVLPPFPTTKKKSWMCVPVKQGIIFLLSHRNLVCIFYKFMTAIDTKYLLCSSFLP